MKALWGQTKQNKKQTYLLCLFPARQPCSFCAKETRRRRCEFLCSRALDSSEQPARASRNGQLVLVDPEKLDPKLVRSDGAAGETPSASLPRALVRLLHKVELFVMVLSFGCEPLWLMHGRAQIDTRWCSSTCPSSLSSRSVCFHRVQYVA